MFLLISSNSCQLNLLLVRGHQAEIIIVKRLIQGRNNVTMVRVEPKSCDQGRGKNDTFTISATLIQFSTQQSFSGSGSVPDHLKVIKVVLFNLKKNSSQDLLAYFQNKLALSRYGLLVI